jgi:two-component system sensor histidine kinase KdpD
LRLAEALGADTQSLVGSNVAETLLEFARAHNVTKIVAGKTAQPRWKKWFTKTVVDQLLEQSGDIDIFVVSGDGETSSATRSDSHAVGSHWPDYLRASVVVGICATLGWAAHTAKLADSNIVMIFLAGVAFVATRMGRWPSIFAAVVSVLLFDFFFVPPNLTFAVSDTQYVITFAVMLGIGVLISELTSRLQSQLHASQEQEQRTGQLFRMTKLLSELSGSDFLIRTAGRQLEEIFGGEVVLFLREAGEEPRIRYGEKTAVAQLPVNGVVAQWVATNGKTAGAGTDTLPNATALIVPLAGSQKVLGALGVAPKDADRFANPDQVRLLETCGSLIALSIERDESVLQAHDAQVRIEAEQLRNSLLSSVSHDLRTPLAAIAGTASGLLESAHSGEKEDLQTIVDEAERLARLVENLLDMARLDSGSIVLNRQWHVLEEIAGVALSSIKRQLKDHQVRVQIPSDFPLLNIDGFLLEQVLVNLLENASRYTPAGSEIEISAQAKNKYAEIRVLDNGPGLPPGSEEKVFDKFFRGATVAPDCRRGVGLGLAICRAIIEAHGGKITAANHSAGGSEFVISLPCTETPPRVEADSALTTHA